MASKTKGYQLKQFLDEIQDKYKCSCCQYVARDIHMLECCRKQVCLSCIEQYLDKQPCPQCQETNFGVVPLKKDDEKISSFRVCCTEKGNGCDWTGQLKELNDHLLKEEDGCQYSPRECPKCHDPVNRCEMTNHLKDSCPERDYNCPHCGYQSTHDFVIKVHTPECSNYPVPCPNLECGVTCERSEMDHHLKEGCEEHYIDCEYKNAGCDVKYRRKNKEEHMKLYREQHRTMYEIHTLKLTEKWQQLHDKMEEKQKQMMTTSEEQYQKFEEKVIKLEQKVTEVIQENQQKAEEINKLKRKIDQLECQLKDQEQRFDQKIQQLKREFNNQDQAVAVHAMKPQQQQIKPMKTVPQQQSDTYQWDFTIDNFTERKANKAKWESPIMTTPRGYKLKLEVWPDGQDKGRGSHISVWLYYVSEEGDERKWSARITMTLELLKQYRVPGDTQKMIIMESFDIFCEKYSSKRRYNCIGTFSNTLIAHKILDENQQFIKDDSLKMQITLLKEEPIGPNQSDEWK